MQRIVRIALASTLVLAALPARAATITEKEAHDIAVEAYQYFYPLVTMEVTRRQSTNVADTKTPGRGPMNTFTNIREFPTAEFRGVVRPNFDTLYSIAWVDLSHGPVLVTAPATKDRYYMLAMLDMWSDVFAVPGKRTTGTEAAKFALVPPGWSGALPAGAERVEAPTNFVWIIGRVQTNGVADYPAVHAIQDGFSIEAIAVAGAKPAPAATAIDPNVDMKTPPLHQVNAMDAESYFAFATAVAKANPPHATDWSILQRMARIGIVPGKTFDASKLDPVLRRAIASGARDGLAQMHAKVPSFAPRRNGWLIGIDTMGVYGDSYLKRAVVAMVGLGANQPEDAVYPMLVTDADGKPLDAAGHYAIHFDAAQIPPVDAFWSVTLYDAEGFVVANPLNRFSIGSRDALKFNADGSLDLYVQSASPGADKESNWLPAPASGAMGLTMRLYAPKPEVLDGRWVPPPVQRVK